MLFCPSMTMIQWLFSAINYFFCINRFFFCVNLAQSLRRTAQSCTVRRKLYVMWRKVAPCDGKFAPCGAKSRCAAETFPLHGANFPPHREALRCTAQVCVTRRKGLRRTVQIDGSLLPSINFASAHLQKIQNVIYIYIYE